MRKRRYLYRLAMSIFGILLLPMVIFIVCFGKYSYEKVEEANEEYCEALMDHYMVQIDQMFIELKQHASFVCAQSKNATSVFWEMKPEDNYWYYQAISETNENYNNFPSTRFGIYYYDEECIIASTGTLSAEEYFKKLEIENLEEEKYLNHFFDADSFEEYNICIGGTERQNEGKNKLLIGFYATLGRQREKVLLFYEYSESDMTEFFESAYIEKGFECSLWNKSNDFSFFFGNYSNTEYKEIVTEALKKDTIPENEELFLVKESKVHPMVLLGYMNEDAPRNIALAFLDVMLAAVSAVVAMVLIGYLLILYIAYKPVFRLTTKLMHTEGEEFETISKALDDRRAKIEEQEMLLLDLLINNLLYRAPIPKGKLKQLGMTEHVSGYTVFLLNGYILSDAETREIIAETEGRFPCRMFATDLEGENRSVFVLFLKNKTEGDLKNWLHHKCMEFGVEADTFCGGKEVSDIKDIWSCLSYCEEELKKITNVETESSEESIQKSNSTRENKRLKLREDILVYIEEHYRDIELTQVQMADHFNISTYTLSRIFRNDVGIGFVAYVNAKRVEYAKELLLTTKKSVHDIAIQSGFDNDNNFFKVFKANTGMSPTTFRES